MRMAASLFGPNRIQPCRSVHVLDTRERKRVAFIPRPAIYAVSVSPRNGYLVTFERPAAARNDNKDNLSETAEFCVGCFVH